jgi:hypothetical protein
MIGKNGATKIVAEAELLRLVLCGHTLRECAAVMRAGYQNIRKMAKEPSFLLQLREHSGEIADRLTEELTHTQVEMAKRLEEASEIALENMLRMATTMDDGTLKYKICQDLLDRDPRASRTKRLEASTTHDFISPMVLMHAAATAKEIEQYEQRKLDGNVFSPTPDSPANS